MSAFVVGADMIGCVGNGRDAATPQVARRLAARRAIPADRDGILRLAQAAHAESAFGTFPFSLVKFHRAYDGAMARPHSNAVVAIVRGDAVLGFAHARCGRHHLSDEGLLITVAALVVAAEARRSLLGGSVALKLLRSIERWRDATGAAAVVMNMTTGLHSGGLERTLARRGWTHVGANMAYFGN